MLAFVKQIFVSEMFFSCNLSNVNSLKCVSMNNQECKVRPEIININSNEPSFYPYSVKISKCSGSCNNANDSYAKMCVPDVVKNVNVRVFNLMSRTNQTRYMKLHETWNPSNCKCECDKSCDIGEYLDYESFKCGKKNWLIN